MGRIIFVETNRITCHRVTYVKRQSEKACVCVLVCARVQMTFYRKRVVLADMTFY